jgi:hypothetical protein
MLLVYPAKPMAPCARLRFLPYAKFETQLRLSERRLCCDIGRHGLTLMSILRRAAPDHQALLKEALVHLGIVAAFAVASLIACGIWLVVW